MEASSVRTLLVEELETVIVFNLYTEEKIS